MELFNMFHALGQVALFFATFQKNLRAMKPNFKPSFAFHCNFSLSEIEDLRTNKIKFLNCQKKKMRLFIDPKSDLKVSDCQEMNNGICAMLESLRECLEQLLELKLEQKFGQCKSGKFSFQETESVRQEFSFFRMKNESGKGKVILEKGSKRKEILLQYPIPVENSCGNVLIKKEDSVFVNQKKDSILQRTQELFDWSKDSSFFLKILKCICKSCNF